ncbi:MAG TPA: 7TM diverse intracellular signaling domain-containing protein [Spirochaetota bacterium]|nr:7TM diverse intracellular signaling domain-containing protein [Spirochaetota bacterium]HPR49973.1 7TM diverse intracellular signaling domain-containing protein [Spirochaetota bacterium]
MHKYVFLTLLVLLPLKAFSAEPIGITKNFVSYPVFQQAEYLEDKNGTLSLGEAKNSTSWNKTSTSSVNFGFTSSVYWFRFAIKNEDVKNHDIYLEIDYPMLDYVDLYSPNEDGSYRVNKTGDLLNFSTREIDDRKIMFKLKTSDNTLPYYLRVQTTSSVNFALNLLSIEAYINKLKQELPAFWAYYGIMVVMLIYNLMIFFLTRNGSYFFYVFYISSWILFQFTLNGFAFQHLWPGLPWWGNKCLPLFISLVTVGCGMMLRTFLQTKEKYPVADKISLALITGPGAVWSLVSLIGPYKIGIKGATAIALIGSATMIILSVILVIRGSRDARFFLFSWVFMMVGIILYTLKTFGALPSNFLTNWSIQIGSSATAILLSGALAENINVMRRQVLRLNKDLGEKESVAKERAVFLEQVVTTVKDMSDNMLTVTDDLASISDKFSQMSGEQEKTSTEMAAGFNALKKEYERLYASIVSQREEGSKTRELSSGIQKSQESITRASQAVSESISQVLESNNQTENTLKDLIDKMSLINKGGESIDRFMTIIDDITDRINLLSLNAAIEAARAGEHGRGFAVVADEIGKLALATSDNSKQISGQVSSIISDIGQGTSLMNNTKKQLELSFGIIDTIITNTTEVKNLVFEQDSAINRIATQAGVMNELAKDIESATSRQNQAIGDAITTIDRIAEMAREISNANNRILDLSALMKEKSHQMNDVINQAT